MVSVQSGDWASVGSQAAGVRRTVFTEEQGVPESIERDALDASAVHIVARNRLGQPVGAGRLVLQDDATGKIGRMAVLNTVRDAGVGRALMNEILSCARRSGLRRVVLHAQTPVVDFYRRLGFETASGEFLEAEIPHCRMKLDLGV